MHEVHVLLPVVLFGGGEAAQVDHWKVLFCDAPESAAGGLGGWEEAVGDDVGL